MIWQSYLWWYILEYIHILRWQYRFLLILQKGPHQERFTFRTLLSKSEKKKFFLCAKKNLFSAEMNCIWWEDSKKVWHLGSSSQEPAPSHTPYHSHTHHPPKSWNMTSNPKCYTFLESSHQMQFISAEKRFFLHIDIGRIHFFGFTK